jgi:undecaprenyl-diphosphatase
VSSSGHLILVPWLFDWHFLLTHPAVNKTFDVALHLGTFLGAVIYFRKDIAKYLGAWFRSIKARAVQTTDERLAWCLVIGTLPGAFVGAVFEDTIEKKLGKPWLIAVMLAVFGVILYLVDRWSRRDRDIDDIRFRDALIIGVAQAVALQPGVSRSGVTITAARALKIKREDAARFSFLMSLPIIGGAGLFKIQHIVDGLHGNAGPFVWGFVASAVSGFLVIAWLLRFLRTRDFAPFAMYRIAVAALVLSIIAAGVRPASGL